MAKKVRAIIKLQLEAGKATPAPPVGPALGQHGVNIMIARTFLASAGPFQPISGLCCYDYKRNI